MLHIRLRIPIPFLILHFLGYNLIPPNRPRPSSPLDSFSSLCENKKPQWPKKPPNRSQTADK
jgi:hypothetical protein